MAQPWVTGPADLYVSLNNQPTQPIYVGNFKVTARIVVQPSFSTVQSDRAGGTKPHDWIYDGKDAASFGDLTIWNWTPLLGMMSVPNSVIAGPGKIPPGFLGDAFGDRGTLMITEGKTITVWYRFPYATKSPFGGFMIPGMRFPYSFLIGPNEFEMGTRENRIPIAWQHASAQQADGSWLCGDADMTGVPAVPPTQLS